MMALLQRLLVVLVTLLFEPPVTENAELYLPPHTALVRGSSGPSAAPINPLRPMPVLPKWHGYVERPRYLWASQHGPGAAECSRWRVSTKAPDIRAG